MMDVVFQVLGYCLLKETYAPITLGRKVARLRKATGHVNLRTAYDKPELRLTAKLRRSFARLWRMLLTQPIVAIVSTYMAWSFGVLYIFLSMFPEVWRTIYHQSVLVGGLHYLGETCHTILPTRYIPLIKPFHTAWGLGEGCGSQLGARLQDIIYRRLSQRQHRMSNRDSSTAATGQAEYRLPLLLPAAALQPLSLLAFVWSVQHHAHWIVPDIFTFVYGMGYIVSWQCLQAYIIDSYPVYAASASGATGVLRCITAFGFPIFAPAYGFPIFAPA